MAGLISSVDIKSFRGIKSLKLDNLSQINILTGDNNCGKTSVLEVLESFCQPNDFRVWRTLIRKDFRETIRGGLSYYEGICDLFDVNLAEKKIEYTITMDGVNTDVLVLAKETEEELTEEEYNSLLGVYISQDDKENGLPDNTQMVSKIEIEIRINGKRVGEGSVYEGQRRFARNLIECQEEYVHNIIYISSVRHAEGNLFLNQVLDNPELYEEMLAVLKEYDENIISINYDNEDNRVLGRGVYKILSKSNQKALPLNVYGDGMKKAVLLMSAVIKAKNGILLLDEFETAIHTSAMNKTFKWLMETCKKLNVQVFLTSHSKEAIDKVLKCSPDIVDDIAVYTMYKDNEEISVRRLDAMKAIEVQDEMGLELR